jgi:hypothetical protein
MVVLAGGDPHASPVKCLIIARGSCGFTWPTFPPRPALSAEMTLPSMSKSLPVTKR